MNTWEPRWNREAYNKAFDRVEKEILSIKVEGIYCGVFGHPYDYSEDIIGLQEFSLLYPAIMEMFKVPNDTYVRFPHNFTKFDSIEELVELLWNAGCPVHLSEDIPTVTYLFGEELSDIVLNEDNK